MTGKIAVPTGEALPKIHQVQWRILRAMSLSASSRFNEIKPKLMDPKRFTYHLDKLQDLGLVTHDKVAGTYTITDKGKVLIAYFTDIPSWGNLPLHSGIMLYIEKEGKVAVVQRDSQPFLGYTGLPYFST